MPVIRYFGLLYLFGFFFVGRIDDPPAPVWPNTFQETFEETINRPDVGTATVKGVYYYDYEHKAGYVYFTDYLLFS